MDQSRLALEFIEFIEFVGFVEFIELKGFLMSPQKKLPFTRWLGEKGAMSESGKRLPNRKIYINYS